ncbi:MAG TPA: TetR/AcrR family transcriptional regulator [Vineibacter sp.]|nr:TetR/AcrR family transcriptional regulator [Vineibacter sp.]
MQQLVRPDNGKVTKAVRTKARLVEVARRLLHEYGTSRLTLRDIATAARMKAGSIYYHFDSRDEILRAVLADGIDRATEAVQAAIAAAGPGSSPLERLHAALRAHLRYTTEQHFSARLAVIRQLPKRLRDHHMKQERDYAAIFAGLLREAQRGGLLRPGFDLSVTRMLSMGALTWVAEWYDPKGRMTLDDIADELMRILVGGVAKAPGRSS